MPKINLYGPIKVRRDALYSEWRDPRGHKKPVPNRVPPDEWSKSDKARGMGNGIDPWKKMKIMAASLVERGWTILWKVEMTSPRGFPYAAESSQCPIAFLTALGDWKKDVLPGAIREAKSVFTIPPKPVEVPKRGYRHFKHLNAEERIEFNKADRRAYMKAYRKKLRDQRDEVADVPVAPPVEAVQQVEEVREEVQ